MKRKSPDDRLLTEMKEILKKKGYAVSHAAALVAEGMGPEELRGILSIEPGAMGSLEYTRRIHRKTR